MKKILPLVIVTFAMIGCFSCDDGNQGGESGSIGSGVANDTLPRLTEQQKVQLKKDVQNWHQTLTNQEWDTHLDYMYPAIWKSDSSKTVLKNQMKGFYDAGYYNLIDSSKVKYISPIVIDSTRNQKIVAVKSFVYQRVVVEEKYPTENPEGAFMGMLRSRYGNNVTYVPEERIFYIQAPTLSYAFLGKDGTFTFLAEQFINSPSLAGLLSFNVVRQLKKYEADTP